MNTHASLRNFRDAADYPAIADVITASHTADGIDEVISAAQVASRYAHAVNFDPAHDTLIAEDAERVIGYAMTDWRIDDAGQHLHWHRWFLLPEYRGQGLEVRMLDYLEDRIRTLAQAHPEGAVVRFAAMAAEAETERVALLRDRGYTPARYFYEMRRSTLDDLPPVVLPPGLELRPVRAEHYLAVWGAVLEAFRDHWGNVTPGEADYRVWLEAPHFDPSLWQVAWDGDQIAGAAIHIIEPAENARFGKLEGWVDDLGVRRPWRGRGLGRALLVAGLHAFRARGMTSAGLGVDAENVSGALRLYEDVGFQAVKRFVSLRKAL